MKHAIFTAALAVVCAGCSGQVSGKYQFTSCKQEVREKNPEGWFCTMDTLDVTIDFTRQHFSACGKDGCEILFMAGEAVEVDNGDLVTFIDGCDVDEVVIFSPAESRVTHFASKTATTYFLEKPVRPAMASQPSKGWVRLAPEERN